MGSSRYHLIQAANASLKRLGTDYIDIYHLHAFDATSPVEETLRALDDLVTEGKVRYIACSNFSGWHLMKSLSVSDRYGWSRYVGNQAYYSLVGRDFEWELMPLGLDQGVGTLVWSPLGWGRLTGKIRRGSPIPAESRLHKTSAEGPQVPEEYLYKVVDAIDEVAKETGKTVPQIALNWLLHRPTVSTIIVGARNEQQLKQNLGAIGWKLTKEQIAKLDAASEVPLAYPYWHQRQFEERNPRSVSASLKSVILGRSRHQRTHPLHLAKDGFNSGCDSSSFELLLRQFEAAVRVVGKFHKTVAVVDVDRQVGQSGISDEPGYLHIQILA